MWFGCGHTGHYCRWCQKPYESKKDTVKDGFCSFLCKQAHYRAYKKYVTKAAGGTGKNRSQPAKHK